MFDKNTTIILGSAFFVAILLCVVHFYFYLNAEPPPLPAGPFRRERWKNESELRTQPTIQMIEEAANKSGRPRIAPDDGEGSWPTEEEFAPADKEAIASLANKMGILSVKRVCLSMVVPAGCRFIRVQSPVSEVGQSRIWLELSMRRQDWTGVSRCRAAPSGSTAQRVGRWVTSKADLRQVRQWRVHENGWHVDVFFDNADLTYPETELIVLAIRHRRLMNQLRPIAGVSGPTRAEVPVFDANAIYQMYVSDAAGTRTYNVCMGRVMATVKIVAGMVELHSYGIVVW